MIIIHHECTILWWGERSGTSAQNPFTILSCPAFSFRIVYYTGRKYSIRNLNMYYSHIRRNIKLNLEWYNDQIKISILKYMDGHLNILIINHKGNSRCWFQGLFFNFKQYRNLYIIRLSFDLYQLRMNNKTVIQHIYKIFVDKIKLQRSASIFYGALWIIFLTVLPVRIYCKHTFVWNWWRTVVIHNIISFR